MKLFNSLNLLSISTTLFSILTIQPVNGVTVNFFTDFDDFNEVTATTLVDDFEDVPVALTPSLTSNGNTYTALDGIPFPNVTGFFEPNVGSNIITTMGNEIFTVDFGVPSTAIGFDTILNGLGPVTVDVFGSTGFLDSIEILSSSVELGFLGIVADEPITSIQWTAIGGGSINTGIDNLLQGESNSVSVPEASNILGLLVFLGFGIYFKKNSRKN